MAKLAKELAAFGIDLQDIQKNQVFKVQLQDPTTGGQVQAVDARVDRVGCRPSIPMWTKL